MINYLDLNFNYGSDGREQAVVCLDDAFVSVVRNPLTGWSYDVLATWYEGGSDSWSHLDDVDVSIVLANIQMRQS